MRKFFKRLLYTILSLLFLSVITFFIWAAFGYKAEEPSLTKALKNEHIVIINTGNYISIKPINYKGDRAYIFYPGAKVQPEAYIAKLSSLAISNNVQVFLPKMFQNLAFFGIKKADMIQNLFPTIKHWYIGGHSLGGSMACMYAQQHIKNIEGILIFGTYSGTDISNCSVKVLSINGTEDGVFPPDKIEHHKAELPKDAKITFIKGLDHADIGNYGSQSGDKPSQLTDENVILQLVNATKGFFE